MTTSCSRFAPILSVLALACLLAACGGGDESTEAEPASAEGGTRTALNASSDPGTRAAQRAVRSRPATVSATAADNTTLIVRARGTLAGNVGPMMQVRVNGVVIRTVEVRSTEPADYSFTVPAIVAGSKVDVAYTNDAIVNSIDRNLFVSYVQAAGSVLMPIAAGTVLDSGAGAAAFDGLNTSAGRPDIYSNGALRFTWPASTTSANQAAQYAASRFLQQASFGATPAQIDRVLALGAPAWINEQIAMPWAADYVPHVQKKYDLGADHRPNGSKYTAYWVAERFWAKAATGPDQLRQRVAFALHQMLMVSFTDSNQWFQSRAYAGYLDTLNKHAFGNYRTLLEEISLSPSMGIYLSHLRNKKEDPATGRLPDENFAREVMQLFTIGLHELNLDGSPKLDAAGKPIETYTNADVMALAKVFTGYSWGFPDNQLTQDNFLWGNPDFSVGNGQGIDQQRMKSYPGQGSSAEKRLFQGKPQAVTIAAGASAAENLRIALDALFRHPNVGPFVGRQLIQRLVTSEPSPAYVARVAAVFNNNGSNVRGDMAAVVRAVLLDSEARNAAPPAGFGKLREPVLRITQWMRGFGATSVTGAYMMAGELDTMSERALYAPSVFGYYRPGYVPPNTGFSARGATSPEFQIVNESTTANWVNKAEALSGNGLGWTGTTNDVSSNYSTLAGLSATGNLAGMLDHLNLLMFAGRMSATLRQSILDAIGGVGGSDSASHGYRARVAVFIALASPEFITQR
jgi:uncharacterized protein (DUF1800 family)